MSKLITAILCSVLFSASTMASSAAEPRQARKAERATTAHNELFRRSNASIAPRNVEEPALSGSQYIGGWSAPAGR